MYLLTLLKSTLNRRIVDLSNTNFTTHSCIGHIYHCQSLFRNWHISFSFQASSCKRSDTRSFGFKLYVQLFSVGQYKIPFHSSKLHCWHYMMTSSMSWTNRKSPDLQTLCIVYE